MKRVFAEIGLGNKTYCSTEFEEDGVKEYRVPKFVKPERVAGYYIRMWFGNTVYIFSSDEGFKRKKKDRKAFKFLFGISGESD
jgi:hypothetical protein